MEMLTEYPYLMEEHLSEKLSLRYWPNPCLSEVCEPVGADEFGENIIQTGNQMIEIVEKLDGLGLAACQVGLLKRIIVMRFLGDKSDAVPPMIMCNPVLSDASTEGSFLQEGCLSLPGVFQQVWRPTEVTMDYQTPEGEARQMVLLDTEARVAFHEIDHLNGINFFQAEGVTRQMRKQVEKEWSKRGDVNRLVSERRLA